MLPAFHYPISNGSVTSDITARHESKVCRIKSHMKLCATQNKVPIEGGSHLKNLWEPPLDLHVSLTRTSDSKKKKNKRM